MAIEGHARGICNLVMGDNMSFHIPIYQRAFTWRARYEVDKLISDIHEFGQEYENQGKADYYIGNVIVKNQSRGFVTERLVIDGQQRITTIILVLCAIRDIYINKNGSEESIRSAKAIGRALYSDEGDVVRLKLNNMEHQTTLNKLLSGAIDTINADDQATNYWRCYQHIRRKFEGMTDQYLQEFADILEKVKVVAIFLDEEQDENSVFESINSAGKPLSGSDLIKNFIFTFRKYDVSHQEEKQLTELYTTNFESLFSTSTKMEDELEAFFREYIAIKTGQKVKKDPKSIYYAFKRWVGEIDTLQNCRCLILDLVKWALIYQTLRTGTHPDIDSNHLGYLRASFLTYATLLMDIVEKLSNVDQGSIIVSDKQGLNAAIEKVVVYDVSRFLAGASAKVITRFIPTIPKKLKTQNPNYFRDYATEFEQLVTTTPEGYRQPDATTIKRTINDHDLYRSRKQLLRFLVLVENIGQKEMISFEEGIVGCQIEHIMPQILTTDWAKVSEPIHQRYLHTLGNLSITFDNSKLSNKGFNEKKQILAKRSRIRLNNILLAYEQFSEVEIRDRAESILHKFFEWYGIYPNEGNENNPSFEFEAITPQRWLNEVKTQITSTELHDLVEANTWKVICDFLNIPVKQDSAHRRLEKWRELARPLWPSTYS